MLFRIMLYHLAWFIMQGNGFEACHEKTMIRQSGEALADQIVARDSEPPLDYAAAFALVGTEAIVFRICEAIW
jgi:hypothetical protein